MGDWDIYLTSDVAAWLEDLQSSDVKTTDLVDDAIYALSRPGPAPGLPLAGTITGSKIKNLKELRAGSSGTSEVRTLFVLTPGARRSCWSPVTSPGSGTGGMRKRSSMPNSCMRSI